MTDEGPPSEPASEATVGAKCAFFASIDGNLTVAGHAVSPPAPAPPPAPPRLSFEAWAELAVRFAGAPLDDLIQALSTQGVRLKTWLELDAVYRRALSDDLRAGELERPALYEAKYKEEQARRNGVTATPAALDGDRPGMPPTPPVPAWGSDPLRDTAGLPDLPGATAEAGRPPFVPPSPEPAAPAKRAAKTVQSKVVPSEGGMTMPLDPDMLQRPTPALPFAGSARGDGMLPVPELTSQQYVSLRLELMLGATAREQTLRRYRVPTERVYEALVQQWRLPARRVTLEIALATLKTWLHKELLV